MAVGYHRLNTSAARHSRARGRTVDAGSSPPVVRAGTRFSCPERGPCVTLECFVSDRDRVKCKSPDGTQFETRGAEVRAKC